MKIIHIVLGKANPHRANGVNKVVHSLAVWMNQNSIQTEVWGITDTPDSDTPNRPYRLSLFKTGHAFFLPPRGMIQEMGSLKNNTIIHFHGVLIPVFSILGAYCRRMKLPYVITPHSALSRQALQRRSWRKRIYLSFFEIRHLMLSSGIQALAEEEAQDIRMLVPDALIKVISNGIDMKMLPSGQKTDSGRPLSPIFGYIGRIEKYQKGLDLLIDGFSMYCKKMGTGNLIIVGDGPDMEWMKNRIRSLKLEERIKITGPLYGDDLSNIRSCMMAIVHPSRWEGMAMSLLESLALGIPGIVSPGTHLDEAINRYQAGWSVPDNDAQGLANAMKQAEKAFFEGGSDHLSASAKKLVMENFTWDYIGNRLLKEIYSQIADYSI